MGRFGVLAVLLAALAAPAGQPHDTAPRFSPDGKLIAFVRSTPPALWVIGVDSRAARRVATLPAVGAFAWTPDGRLLYEAGAELRVVAADGSGDRRLTYGSIGKQPVSRGGLVAFANRDGLFVVPLEGGEPRRVLPGAASNPSFGPHGLIAYSERAALWVTDLSGSTRRISPGTGSPVWSPDGQWIGYAGSVVAPDALRAAAVGDDGPFAWSPDSRSALVRRGGSLWIVDVGSPGSPALRRVPAAAEWSPDGATIVFANAIAGCRRSGVAVLRLRDEAIRRLTQDCRRIGTGRRDRIVGTPLSDVIYGLAGDDRLVGGGAEDVLYGGAGRDVLLARDGVRDAVVCGPGRDVAYADRFDTVRGCETVIRR